MLSPYDWQEGMGNRAQYVEARLAQGLPVLAVSLDAGLLMYSRRRQSRKIYEIYDKIAFAGLGQPSDLEAIRTAALEFASREGFNRSEDDVNVQRVVTAVSTPIRRAFGDFNSAPVVARSLFAELHAVPQEDRYYVVEYDGDFALARQYCMVAGTAEQGEQLQERLKGVVPSTTPEDALDQLAKIFDEVCPTHEGVTLVPEAVLIERQTQREDRFRMLLGAHD